MMYGRWARTVLRTFAVCNVCYVRYAVSEKGHYAGRLIVQSDSGLSAQAAQAVLV